MRKLNKKEYEHIAVSLDVKNKFEKLRYKLVGERLEEITQNDLLLILLNKFEESIK